VQHIVPYRTQLSPQQPVGYHSGMKLQASFGFALSSVVISSFLTISDDFPLLPA
jgi:hypothetical protein